MGIITTLLSTGKCDLRVIDNEGPSALSIVQDRIAKMEEQQRLVTRWKPRF